MSQSKARVARKGGLRDQLARKRAKVITLYFPIGEEGEKAAERFEQAEGTLASARRIKAINDKADFDIPALEQAAAEAQADRDERCLTLRIRGLSEDERDALASEYVGEEVPDGADAAKKKEILEANTAKNKEWTYHALAAVAQDSDLTADEWREELTSDRWTAGDLDQIRVGILRAYGAQPADGIPKG